MKVCRKIFTTATLAFMVCLLGIFISGEAQANRFVDNGNGTVTDTETDLMWTKDTNPMGEKNFNDAMSACSSFSIDGISGWRLPSKEELVDLFNAMQDGHPFTGIKDGWPYRSSTIREDNDKYAWGVRSNGYTNSRDNTYRDPVWPVRDIQ